MDEKLLFSGNRDGLRVMAAAVFFQQSAEDILQLFLLVLFIHYIRLQLCNINQR